jgi:hypothetical protein
MGRHHTDADPEYYVLNFVLNYNGSAMQFAHEKWIVYHKILAFMASTCAYRADHCLQGL